MKTAEQNRKKPKRIEGILEISKESEIQPPRATGHAMALIQLYWLKVYAIPTDLNTVLFGPYAMH